LPFVITRLFLRGGEPRKLLLWTSY